MEAVVDYDAFLPDVMLDLPDEIPEGLALQCLRNKAIEFCRSTQYWREDLDPIILIEGQTEYEIVMPPGLQLVDPMVVTADGYDAPLIKRDAAQGMDGTYWQYSPYSINVLLSRYSGSLLISASVAPSKGSAVVAKAVCDRYGDAIVAGAKSLIWKMNQPWRDLNLAAIESNTFSNGVHSARLQAQRAFGKQHVNHTPKRKFY